MRELGFTPHVSRGESRTIIGVIGDETKPGLENFSAIPGVEQVLANNETVQARQPRVPQGGQCRLCGQGGRSAAATSQ